MRNIAGVVVMVALLAGCGGKGKGYETLATEKNADKAGSLIQAADTLWAERADQAKLRAALSKYEAAAQSAPENRHVHERLVRGWYFLADGFLETKDEKIEAFEKAKTWGQRCMAINKDFAARVDGGENPKTAVEVMAVADAPCIYWTASALGKWAKANGIMKSLKYIGTVKAYIAFVEENDPDFWHFGPARYWGAYYSIIPSFAGQDFDKSGEYFETSIKGAPSYLGTRVLRAENHAVGTQNVKAFDADLDFVINFDVSTMPELIAENTMEIEKAKAIKAQRSELLASRTVSVCAFGCCRHWGCACANMPCVSRMKGLHSWRSCRHSST